MLIEIVLDDFNCTITGVFEGVCRASMRVKLDDFQKRRYQDIGDKFITEFRDRFKGKYGVATR